MSLSHKMQLAEATLSLASVIVDAAKAAEKFREGKKDEGWRYAGTALKTGYDHWGQFGLLFEDLSSIAREILGTDDHAKISAIKGSYAEGVFSGTWYYSGDNKIVLIFHDKNTSALWMHYPRATGGFNIYHGGIELNLGILLWTGQNSAGEELIIVGYPDHECTDLSCEIWRRNFQTDRMEPKGEFELRKL
jgi:hypothetical protein